MLCCLSKQPFISRITENEAVSQQYQSHEEGKGKACVGDRTALLFRQCRKHLGLLQGHLGNSVLGSESQGENLAEEGGGLAKCV